MSCPINPLGDRIVATSEEAKSVTASGIYLPDNAKEKSKIAVVEEVGPAVQQVKRVIVSSTANTALRTSKLKEQTILWCAKKTYSQR